MTNKIEISRELAERVRELFDYEMDTGHFIRKVKANCKGGHVGSIAGSVTNEGRITIRIDGIRYFAHRLAFLYVNGEWPKDMVDHIDMDTSNNAWGNLRECGNGQNKMNAPAQANNALGVKNVHRVRNGSYKASICKDGHYHQKIFKTVEEASIWAESKRKELHGEFARG